MSGAVHKRECLGKLFALWQKKPNLRLGQLLVQAGNSTEILYNLSDPTLLEAVESFIQLSEKEDCSEVSACELLNSIDEDELSYQAFEEAASLIDKPFWHC